MRVVELFGPTIQGEGPYAGRPCHFLRLGGCDYRCSWCDTMYAVDPELVREAEDLSELEVAEALAELAPAPMLVLSGGNPALWKLDALLDLLRPRYSILTIETQGSVWRPWLGRLDMLVVSPKPPSSGMATLSHRVTFERFMTNARIVRELASMRGERFGVVLKVVVFDEDDLTWAAQVRDEHADVPFFLSVGTDVEDPEPLEGVSRRYRWLCERVAGDPAWHGAVVLPQLHVIAWGHRVGV